jgi:hypothetical protein
MSEAMASLEVRAGPLIGWLGAEVGGGEVARATSVAGRGAPPEGAATATGAAAGAAVTMNGFWQLGQLICVPA